MVQTTFMYGEKGADGKVHNYWVYHLLEIAGTEIKLSKPSPDFPKWVWFTFKPNHKETAQLTKEQKDSLWSRHVKGTWNSAGLRNAKFELNDGIFYKRRRYPVKPAPDVPARAQGSFGASGPGAGSVEQDAQTGG